tara:strand:+ start:804 stop:1667 length:864 start_codon:yes stop_codon:yes gene_type:complete
MPKFHERTNKKINDFEVSVYEVDNKDAGEQLKLEEYLTSKIKNIKIYNDLDKYADLLNVPNIDAAFAEKLKASIKEICDPKKHPIQAFDIRRSFVTEFLSQLLLERNYSCVFYEEADKKINVDPVLIEKHSAGIDVTGIQRDTDAMKFVVCEVKASNSKIPCTESEPLLNDIKKAYELENKRLTREILSYCRKLNDTDDDMLTGVVEFLVNILAKKDDKEFVLDNIIFFPFLIRQNADIVTNSDVSDYNVFGEEKFNGSAIKGIIWSFNNDINTFCQNIWSKALADA